MQYNKTLNFKASLIIAIAGLLSRTLGLVREILFNNLFGSHLMGLFLIAFRAPNLLRDLFAEGVLSIAFITIFSKTIEKEGDDSAWSLASKVLTLVGVFMGVISFLGIIFAGNIIAVLAPGFSKENGTTTILLTQIMYPFIFCISLSALVMGILNSKNIFGIPALASSFFNIGSIVGGLCCGWIIDPGFGPSALIGLAIGTVMGGLLQLLIQLPSLRKAGFHFKLDFRWNDSRIYNILALTFPGIIAASAVQINVLMSSMFSSYLGSEAIAWLYSAFRLVLFPIGIFGVAVSTITLPVLSRVSAVQDFKLFSLTLSRALRFVVFLTMPISIFLFILAEPIVSLVYEHGRFNAIDSYQTARALQFYSLGIITYSCIKVLSPAFYAIEKKWTPMFISITAVFISIALNYIFIFHYKLGHQGLALSTTITAVINFTSLFYILSRSYDLQIKSFINHFILCGIASSILAAICWLGVIEFHDCIYNSLFYIKFISLGLLFFLCLGMYLCTCRLLKIDNSDALFAFFSQRTRKIFNY